MGMTYRPLGRHEVEVSAIGLGGFHLGLPEDPDVAVEMVRTAVDGGITFMDNCWDYHLGESELRMGRALGDGYRERVFLMTKLDSRTADGTLRQFEQSLDRLQTDHIDLLQLHEVIHDDDVERAFGRGGCIEAYLKLRDEGAVRFIGFTGHKDPEFHLRFLRAALDRGIVPDSVQMPVSAFDASYKSFSERVLPVCQEHGIGVIGMKSLGAGEFLGQSDYSAPTLLAWALSHPVATLVTGCETVEQVHQAIDAASDFEPMSAAEKARVVETLRPLAVDGHMERWKTGVEFDGTSGSPEWMA